MIPAVFVPWLQFLLCAVLIGIAGSRLSFYGDVIAEKTGLGGNWVGLMLMATVTSLPELVTGITSVTVANTPDIAVGNVLGACVINLAMLFVLDLLHRGQSVYTRASHGHILSAGFGVILAGFVGANVLFAAQGMDYTIGTLGLYTPFIFLLYAVAVRTVFRYEQRSVRPLMEEAVGRYEEITLRQASVRYGVAALVVVAVGVWLPYIGADIARVMEWEQSFVGTLFIALATTLPEITVTIAAIRLGALDMAMGNLLGSNLFNLLILGIDDLFFLQGPLFSHTVPVHAASAFSVVMMSGVVIVGLLYRPESRLFVGWASLVLLSIYLLNTSFLYLYGG